MHCLPCLKGGCLMKKKLTAALFLFLFTLTSCSLNPADWVFNTRDYSKLYIGGYKTVSNQDDSSDVHDYFLYVSFCSKTDSFDSSSSSLSYDYEICLNNSSFTSLGQKSDIGSPVFVELSDAFSRSGIGMAYSGGLESFFGFAGGYVSVFSSVGRLDSKNPFLSKRARIGASGQICCFETISTSGQPLSYSTSAVYKQSFNIGGQQS